MPAPKELKARQDQEKDEELAVALVETLVEAKAYSNAIPILRGALARNPKDPRLHYLMGSVLRDKGIYRQAERSLLKSLQFAPKLAASWSALGILYDLKKEHFKAESHHMKAVELAPEVPRYHNNLGFSRFLAFKTEGAIAAYEEAIRLEPSKPHIYMNLGFALARARRDEEALRMFRQAGSEAEALHNLALAQELRGEPEHARRNYRQALKQDPALDSARLKLKALSPTHASKELP